MKKTFLSQWLGRRQGNNKAKYNQRWPRIIFTAKNANNTDSELHPDELFLEHDITEQDDKLNTFSNGEPYSDLERGQNRSKFQNASYNETQHDETKSIKGIKQESQSDFVIDHDQLNADDIIATGINKNTEQKRAIDNHQNTISPAVIFSEVKTEQELKNDIFPDSDKESNLLANNEKSVEDFSLYSDENDKKHAEDKFIFSETDDNIFLKFASHLDKYIEDDLNETNDDLDALDDIFSTNFEFKNKTDENRNKNKFAETFDHTDDWEIYLDEDLNEQKYNQDYPVEDDTLESETLINYASKLTLSSHLSSAKKRKSALSFYITVLGEFPYYQTYAAIEKLLDAGHSLDHVKDTFYIKNIWASNSFLWSTRHFDKLENCWKICSNFNARHSMTWQMASNLVDQYTLVELENLVLVDWYETWLTLHLSNTIASSYDFVLEFRYYAVYVNGNLKNHLATQRIPMIDE